VETPSDISPSFPVNLTSASIDKLTTLGKGFCFGVASPTSSFGCTQL
jgi:hypothetical protein